MSITCNSYFSGAGLFDVGLSLAGIELQQSFEIDSHCCATLKKNFTHEVHQVDISGKLVLDDKESDIIVGTYPCTRYSSFSQLYGHRTGDNLFLHFFRHIAIRRPEVYVVENVPGMKQFPVVMEAMTQLPDYYVSVFCPVSAQDVGLPQNRKRLILIGSKKRFNWSKPVIRRNISLAEILERGAAPLDMASIKNRLSGKYRDKPIVSDPDRGDIAPCCLAHYHKDRSTRLVKDGNTIRPYTVREYARLQGVPDWFEFSGGENAAYKQIGNGVPVPIGEWVGREIHRYFRQGVAG